MSEQRWPQGTLGAAAQSFSATENTKEGAFIGQRPRCNSVAFTVTGQDAPVQLQGRFFLEASISLHGAA